MDTTTLIGLLASFGFFQWIGVIISLIIFFSISNIGHILKWYHRKKLTKGRSGELKSVHATCRNYRDIESIVTRAIERAIKVFDIRYYHIIREQMVVIDKMFINLKDLTVQSYKNLYASKGLENDPMYRRDLRAYDKIFDFIIDQSRETLRDWVRINHLTDKTDPEFLIYVKETSSTLMRDISASFDREYWSEDFLVTRDENKKWNYDHHAQEVEETIVKCLYAIKEIARKKLEEIIELENEDIYD